MAPVGERTSTGCATAGIDDFQGIDLVLWKRATAHVAGYAVSRLHSPPPLPHSIKSEAPARAERVPLAMEIGLVSHQILVAVSQ